MTDLIQRFTSRKFLLAVFGAITVIVLPRMGIELSGAELTALTVMVTSFIGVEGAADFLSRANDEISGTEEVTQES
jgi:uncharacterized membrane protein